MTRLSPATLDLLPDGVAAPGRADSAPAVGIAHLGVGNFHRSHQAMYVGRLLEADPGAPWGICGIGVREQDRALIGALAEQGGLYSLSLFHADGALETEVIGSIRELMLVPDDPEATLARLCDPRIRIVSMTITESGYVQDPGNGRHAATDPEVRADVEAGLAAPRSAFGLLVAALRARREAGTAPFTVLSCDNIQGNGQVARASVVATAALVSDELAQWIDAHVAFPSTMVDRITPRPTSQQLAAVQERLGLHDEAAVVAEPFKQWVLEDDFPAGRPHLEQVGAVFVENIDHYEMMKLRLLNGAHQVAAYLGIQAGHTFVHEVAGDPRVSAWIERYSLQVALPTLTLPEGVDGEDYIQVLAQRFANPQIADTLERIATDSEDRLAKFVLPALADARDLPAFGPVAAAILACWAHTIATTDSQVILASISADVLAAVRSEDDPAAFLSSLQWLAPLSQDARLHDVVAAQVRALRQAPPEARLEALGPATL